MTDDHVSEVEGSSIPPEPVSPQLSASSSNDKPKLQPMDELLERYEYIPMMHHHVRAYKKANSSKLSTH